MLFYGIAVLVSKAVYILKKGRWKEKDYACSWIRETTTINLHTYVYWNTFIHILQYIHGPSLFVIKQSAEKATLVTIAIDLIWRHDDRIQIRILYSLLLFLKHKQK